MVKLFGVLILVVLFYGCIGFGASGTIRTFNIIVTTIDTFDTIIAIEKHKPVKSQDWDKYK